MKILWLKLTDFCCHESLEVDFADGIVGVVGRNGKGKSSILDAIRLAVTGESVGEGNQSNNVRWGATTAKVEMAFQQGLQEYKITRTIGKKSSQELVAPEITLYRQTEIETYLTKLLDTSFEWWRYGSSDDWYRRLNENISIVMQVSAHESFGYVAVDAMGYGRPAVMGPSIVYGPDEWHCGTEQPRQIADVILGILDGYPAASALARRTAEQVAQSQNAAYAAIIKKLLEHAT
jgi:ABC-type cobalamin/Fe3+-siderophores transport system ATPase subunit